MPMELPVVRVACDAGLGPTVGRNPPRVGCIDNTKVKKWVVTILLIAPWAAVAAGAEPVATKPAQEAAKPGAVKATPKLPAGFDPHKKPVKKKPREVPTTQIEKTVPPEETTRESAESAPETGEIAFDTDNFPFAHYISRMRRKIAAHWRVPAGSQGELLCVIYFRVTRDGTVMATAIEQSSGLFMFDQAAQRAIVQASPMPPLPQEYRDEYLGVHFSFAFREER